MKSSQVFLCSLLSAVGDALNCTPSAFSSILPPNAHVRFATQLSHNSTFDVAPLGDIGYPTSPTGLQALCAIEVNVTSSNSSAYSFGLFLPNDWNERYLAVGNGGFAGGNAQVMPGSFQTPLTY